MRCAISSVSVSERMMCPVARELLAQLDEVLDDAVVHDGDAPRAVDVRVGVLLARLAVRRPARVPDAHTARERRLLERVPAG